MSFNTEAYVKDAIIQGSPVDHTYVICSGNRFRCFGEDTGGHLLAGTQGVNDLNKLKILNESPSVTLNLPIIGDVYLGTDAGIIYAVNGVCHIASNRLMVQSRNTVEGARGAIQSFTLFGKYGTRVPRCAMEVLLGLIGVNLPDWARNILGTISDPVLNSLRQELEWQLQAIWLAKLRKADLRDPAAIEHQGSNLRGGRNTISPTLSDTDRKNNADVWTEYHRSEMESVWRNFFGKDYDQGKITELAAIQEESRESPYKIRGMKTDDAKETLSERINRDAANLSKQFQKVLSAEEYSRFIGGDTTAQVKISDPDIENAFYAQQGRISFRLNDASHRKE